jgi:hypothetical protein
VARRRIDRSDGCAPRFGTRQTLTIARGVAASIPRIPTDAASLRAICAVSALMHNDLPEICVIFATLQDSLAAATVRRIFFVPMSPSYNNWGCPHEVISRETLDRRCWS